MSKRKLIETVDYWDNDTDGQVDDTRNVIPRSVTLLQRDDEIDPLDAFMAEVDAQIKVEASTVGQSKPLPEIVSEVDREYDTYEGISDDVDNSDDEHNDGKKRVKELPAVDHSTIAYPLFTRDFYSQYASTTDEALAAADDVRIEHGIQVSGQRIPNPISTFATCGLPPQLLKAIDTAGFTAPTPIQRQALPVALSGRDLIGLSKTGSGKTLAYLLPMIVHILAQPQMKQGDGPIGLILSPTRELAIQIYANCNTFARDGFNMRTVCLYGGASKWEMQQSLLSETPEIIVATPGRLIDLIRRKSTNLSRVTMVVLDEADKMLDMGFEGQTRSIVATARPAAQKLLFSATMKKSVETFAFDLLQNPVKVIVGSIGMANPDIRQVVHVVDSDHAKWTWLASNCDDFVADGKVLVFVNTKSDAEGVSQRLIEHFRTRRLAVGVACLHGDKDQGARDAAIRTFSKADGDVSVLVATDVASRGLHVSEVRTVINYDTPARIEVYVHRIGRTGRGGKDGQQGGTAHTLLNKHSHRGFADSLINTLRQSHQEVSRDLQVLARPHPAGARGLSVTQGSHREGDKRGIGHGQVAVTSAMLAGRSGVSGR